MSKHSNPESHGWSLNAIGEMLDRQAEQRKQEEADLTAKLGTPHWRSGDEGYWRVQGGVIRYRFSLGTGHVIKESRFEYDDELITKLGTLQSITPLQS